MATAAATGAAVAIWARWQIVEQRETVSIPNAEIEALKRDREWFRYFFSFYASMERLDQFDRTDERSRVYAEAIEDFIKINDVESGMLCPATSDGLHSGTFTFFGSRITFLTQRDGTQRIYAMSYHGANEFIHGGRPFDSLTPLPAVNARTVLSEPVGLAERVLADADASVFTRGSLGYYAPISANVADIDGDEIEDFALGGRLVLSSGNGGYRLSDDRGLEGREIVFLHHSEHVWLASPIQSAIEIYDPQALADGVVARLPLVSPPSDLRPFTLLPLNQLRATDGNSRFLLISEERLDVYSITPEWTAVLEGSLSGLQPGEMFIGAWGDFAGDARSDVWLSEPRRKDTDGRTVGRLSLLTAEAFDGLTDGRVVDIAEIAFATVVGSPRYTDYDGIGSTLSATAGDFDGDGRVDLSFSGHRHMSEAGALFILKGAALRKGNNSVTDPGVIKIVGRPVSELAPPFNHLDSVDVNSDGRDDVVVAADNDLCSGLSAGSISLLDGALILHTWNEKTRSASSN